ncbi:hypothetical protein THII_0582 [Thioploca ingrica]|uniref:RiboL-PSP-HEPN domain-containing protein n=1 Tax=Thioploca ingrica TaxID=40754 RepID=A0A090ADJ7_9GAMM|nr:hypothetical protein THII_0582 [Thioploca ingrica]
MNSPNPLEPIFNAFLMTKESNKIVRFILNNAQSYPQLLNKLGKLKNYSNPQQQLDDSREEIEDLFVVNLWATFERWLRNYFQEKGNILNTIVPNSIGTEFYKHFEKEIEFWQPLEMLDIIKNSLFAHSEENKQLVGHAKQILEYRNWIAHGKNPKKLPSISQIAPNATYNTLKILIELIEPSQSHLT